MDPTIEMLRAETLTQKHKRLRRAKCEHEEIFSSTVAGPAGTFTTAVCLECGQSWRS